MAKVKVKQPTVGAGRIGILLLVASAVVLTALAVVYAKYQSRTLFAELQGLKQEQDKMDVEWGQLQLEQSTWATHGRIEDVARKKLGMILPAPEQVMIIRHE